MAARVVMGLEARRRGSAGGTPLHGYKARAERFVTRLNRRSIRFRFGNSLRPLGRSSPA